MGMLVIEREVDGQIVIRDKYGGKLDVYVVAINGKKVKLGFTDGGNRYFGVWRKEVDDAKQQEKNSSVYKAHQSGADKILHEPNGGVD